MWMELSSAVQFAKKNLVDCTIFNLHSAIDRHVARTEFVGGQCLLTRGFLQKQVFSLESHHYLQLLNIKSKIKLQFFSILKLKDLNTVQFVWEGNWPPAPPGFEPYD